MLEKSIKKLENSFKNGNDISVSILMALRNWQAFRFLDDSKAFSGRANHIALAVHRRNPADLGLYILTIFIAIEAGNFDTANEMLDKAMNYKSFLRTNDPFYYGVLCFLYAYLELHQKRTRSAKKHWRALTDFIKTTEPHPDYQIMQGLLHLTSEEYAEAYGFFTEAFLAGSDSIFLYEGLFRYYKNANQNSPQGISILPVLIYAAKRGADIKGLADKYQETLFAAINTNPSLGEKLYEISNYPPILREICANRIKKNDLSFEAYIFYSEAETKQIYIKGLFETLIKAAYKNKIENINHYPMAQFLAGSFEMDMDLSTFVFHLLLTSPKLADLLPDWQGKILQHGTRLIKTGATGRAANSIYYYFWQRCKALGITGVDIDKAEEILKENITFFELQVKKDSLVKHVYITEPEKRGMAEYEIPDNDEYLIIEAVGTAASYTCLGANQKSIINEHILIKPMIILAGAELYLHFFQKGDRRFHVLAYLANHYLSLEKIPDEATPVFEALISARGITKAYRNRILVALGRLHYDAFSFEEALECYGAVDDEALGDDFTPQILSVFMQTREFGRAVSLINSKHMYIDNETLFTAINALIIKSDESKKVANVAYKLLTKGFYSEEMLDLVLNHFNASYKEIATLSNTLDEDNIIAPSLDAIVVEAALEMALFDPNAQKAFIRLLASRSISDIADEKANLILDFIELATFEMVAKATKPEYNVLDVLEKWCLENDSDNTLLTWGLASTFLKHNITTFKSEEIINLAISSMEREGILLPIFKENKPYQVPFIEKHQSFLYKAAPGKDCWLYYRLKDDKTFTAVPMRYIKYGLYVASVPLFYNEEIVYYFSEEMVSGSITTKEAELKNTVTFIHENSDDPFFTINNAIIYEKLFKHDRVEEIISHLVKDYKPVRSTIL